MTRTSAMVLDWRSNYISNTRGKKDKSVGGSSEEEIVREISANKINK